MKKIITYSSQIKLLIVFLFFNVISISATDYYFHVAFTDKNNTPFTLSNPSAYLSARAIARRAAFGLSCDSTDLPVNSTYVTAVKNLGVYVHSASKWMNSVNVLVSDSSIMSQVRALQFVKKVQYTGKANATPPLVPRQKFPKATEVLNYGSAATQINQVNGSYLHNLGYTGTGIHVGVLDAGFNNANINVGFDSMRIENRLLGIKNISGTADIYALHQHGANVLSIMTGNLPSQYLGSAPDASFWLIRTEVDPTEYLVEVDFWVSGIEFADSVGVDVVNSSLGYTTFDDPSMNFTYADMNGLVSRASRAATLAAGKGIIVCNSAGNNGNITDTWHYIGSPADADRILTVGSVTSTGIASSFSSYGPTSDMRDKPDITAMGTSTAIINTSGIVNYGNGTSYSSPVIAGMMACFLQYVKANRSYYTIDNILHSVISSGSLYGYYNPQMGNGIPNFQVAAANLPTFDNIFGLKSDNVNVLVDNANKLLSLKLVDSLYLNGHLQIYNSTGQQLLKNSIQNNYITFNISNFQSGIYLVSISKNGLSETHKIILR